MADDSGVRKRGRARLGGVLLATARARGGSGLMSLKVIHFQSIFLIDFYRKRPIYVQKYGITHQTTMHQEIQEKEEFLQ